MSLHRHGVETVIRSRLRGLNLDEFLSLLSAELTFALFCQPYVLRLLDLCFVCEVQQPKKHTNSDVEAPDIPRSW